MDLYAFADVATIYSTATIVKQNNYYNLYMQTIGSQLIRIEESLDEIQTNSKGKGKVDETKILKLDSTLIKHTIEAPKDWKWKVGKDNTELLVA